MNGRFQDKVAVVTGGCRGIGLSISERFLKEGAKVYALDYLVPEEPLFNNEELNANIKAIQADVTKDDSVRKAIEQIMAEAGRIDILVNNAGVTRDNLLLRMTEEQWDMVISTNLKGSFLCVKNVAKVMMSQRKGKIINIGSVVGVMGNAGQANYSASKAGMIGLTKSLAKEFASRNINVNLVAPGYVRTPMTDKLTEEQTKAYYDAIPLKRIAEPEDIANAVTFLASDEASYITGEVLNVNGGLMM